MIYVWTLISNSGKYNFKEENSPKPKPKPNYIISSVYSDNNNVKVLGQKNIPDKNKKIK